MISFVGATVDQPQKRSHLLVLATDFELAAAVLLLISFVGTMVDQPQKRSQAFSVALRWKMAQVRLKRI